MRKLIRRFRDEHATMKHLLELFAAELDSLRDPASDPDYHLLSDIVHYFTDFPDRVHHPAEELLLLRLQMSQPELQPVVDRLSRQHDGLTKLGQKLRLLLGSACSGHMVPRDELLEANEQFLERHHKHIDDEETLILANAEVWLNSRDWIHIEKAIQRRSDPVVDKPIREELERLVEAIDDLADIEGAA